MNILMYKCIEPTLGLRVNKHFKKVRDALVYGDMFVFKYNKSEFAHSGKVKYQKMGTDLLPGYENKPHASELLCILAILRPSMSECLQK